MSRRLPYSKTSNMNVTTRRVEREERALAEIAFARLLEWLDDGIDSHGETYLEMRRRLAAYFDRRNRPDADHLADETLNRVGRTLETSGSITITPPARYCYLVARFVLLEDIRRGRRFIQVDEARTPAVLEPPGTSATASIQERRLDCLDRCLHALKPEQRALAIEYYRDARRQRIDRRRTLAAQLGITMNALGIRACRIRNAIEACLDACCNNRSHG
jgi:DNA-directed RNA polymerase specialized sigma24 family protein